MSDKYKRLDKRIDDLENKVEQLEKRLQHQTNQFEKMLEMLNSNQPETKPEGAC